MAKSEEKKSKKSKSTESRVISGYYVLPVIFPGASSSDTDSDSGSEDFSSMDVEHYIYLREHKNPGVEGNELTLFMANVPIDATTLHVRVLVAQLLGSNADDDDSRSDSLPVSVTFLPSPTGPHDDSIPSLSSFTGLQKSDSASRSIRRILPTNSAAQVVFANQTAFSRVLKAIRHIPSTPLLWTLPSSSSTDGATGLSRYTAIHARQHVPATVLQSTLDVFMQRFDAEEAEREQAAKRARSEPDADGFITVSRGAGAGRAGVAMSSDAVREVAREKMRKKELKDFYRYQVRERKKEKMNDLLRNFKRDQERIVELKARRKFKPFAGTMA
ncbi:ribosomal RNA-processing protein 7-domain-containing protein [Kockiozyma suomiensis]|uniref:ribosomal RNA-processing protein 7-domain-containing protein n=1 Tax=Kockiozyma suomiensis TaxID=1337062 RepID=UPI0033442E81